MFFTTGDESESSSSSQWPQTCRRFEFAEIQLATDNFDKQIGGGGFGKVYKGTILNGSSLVAAAFKRLDSKSKQGEKEFRAEVETLSKLRHDNIVSLIGYCNDEKEMILVYEYMPNGSLEDHLHKLSTPLSWLQRLKICIGAARGLEYLHAGRVVHRDVKSSNILLHERWEAKISDFGLSKDQPMSHVSTKVNGSFGYLDPYYYDTGRLTMKSDVYALGVLLFEVLSRKRAVDGGPDHEEWGLAKLAQDCITKSSLIGIIDSELRDQISPKSLKIFVRIAHRCLHADPNKRPMMAEVVSTLELVLVLQEKTNNSVQDAGITMFGRMVYMFPFLPFSKGEHSGAAVDSKISSNIKDVGMGVTVERLQRENSDGDGEWLDFNAKLGYFGLARSGPEIGSTHVSTLVRGTFGYVDPEYCRTGRLTRRSDIYSFGVVLLQTLTGQQAIDMKRPEGQEGLVRRVCSLKTEGRLKESELKKIMDPGLEQKYPIKGALECAALALRCVAEESKHRPTSAEVLSSLEKLYATNN